MVCRDHVAFFACFFTCSDRSHNPVLASVAEGGRRGEALLGIPAEAGLNETRERAAPAVNHVGEQQGSRCAARPAPGGGEVGLAVLVEVVAVLAARPRQRQGTRPAQLREQGHLLPLAVPAEEGVPRPHLGQQAAHAPHVDGHRVGQPQDHLRRAVEPALYVGLGLLSLEAGGPKVNEAHGRRALLVHQQDVLRLQVAVHDPLATQERQRLQHLASNRPDEGQVAPVLEVLLGPLVQVAPEQREGKYNMIAEHQLVYKMYAIGSMLFVIIPYPFQNHVLNLCLLMEDLLVLDDLDGHRLPPGLVVQPL
eukprot:CAMPEP_0113940898 /NCGR_PEP_ID=MMETSP1339-20121228/6923_1 /TAXON_ID=94617 /ORGANISM="Fibrocapsa japonica" /LENGTH=307 /DNA_ID=CAMNT_0000944869 /DNA_START=300 /DNA_END=1224 /DNA_ORIENTATION=- /assembly_acc=CAM_ASM_000762